MFASWNHGCRFEGEIFEHIYINEEMWISIKMSRKFAPRG